MDGSAIGKVILPMMEEGYWHGWGGMLFGPFGMIVGLILLIMLVVVIVRAMDRK